MIRLYHCTHRPRKPFNCLKDTKDHWFRRLDRFGRSGHIFWAWEIFRFGCFWGDVFSLAVTNVTTGQLLLQCWRGLGNFLSICISSWEVGFSESEVSEDQAEDGWCLRLRAGLRAGTELEMALGTGGGGRLSTDMSESESVKIIGRETFLSFILNHWLPILTATNPYPCVSNYHSASMPRRTPSQLHSPKISGEQPLLSAPPYPLPNSSHNFLLSPDGTTSFPA